MNRARILLVAGLLGAVSACGSNTTTPTPPTPQTFTEVFSGTLAHNDATSYPFIAQASGQVIATLTSVAPDSTSILGLSLGTVQQGGGCQVLIDNDKATQSSSVVGAVGTSGNLCVRVYDSGSVTTPIDYQLTVVHP